MEFPEICVNPMPLVGPVAMKTPLFPAVPAVPVHPVAPFAPVAPVPVRPLLGNEEFTSGLTGPGVERNDLAASTDAVSFTLADRALLNQILVLLQNLAVGK